MKRIILDVDTGIDDSIAILYALKAKELKVEGVTTGFGNVSSTQATLNTLQVIELTNQNIPVIEGASAPLFRNWKGPVTRIHGSNGVGDYNFSVPGSVALQGNAADFIVKKINEFPQELTLVCVGRMTNLALALVKDPSIVHKVKEVIFMGGSLLEPGNVTPVAEANIAGDPEAAHRVFASGIPLIMVGLDVTMKSIFTDDHLQALIRRKNIKNQKILHFIEHIMRFRFQAHIEHLNILGSPLHDPLAVAVAIDPTFITSMNPYQIYVETKGELSSGATLADLRTATVTQEKTNCRVCLEVDQERFLIHLMDTLCMEGE